MTGAGQTNWAFLRSSADNFATDLGSVVIVGENPFTLYSFPLALTNIVSSVEFRLYVYATRVNNNDIFRLDDATFYGSAGALPSGVQVATVNVTDANASEPGADTGTFSVTRYGDASATLDVNYSLGGTAVNGLDYSFLTGIAHFAIGQTNVLVTVTPLNDNIPELTETAKLTLLSGPNYTPNAFYSAATVNIADDGDTTPLFSVSVTDTNAYERLAALSGLFTLTRSLGDTAPTVTVNFTLGGTAVLGVDYNSSVTNSVTFTPGQTTHISQSPRLIMLWLMATGRWFSPFRRIPASRLRPPMAT
jgi:hypothetical protein